MRWYYSERLKLYIDLEPLKFDKRVKDVGSSLGVKYDYDVEKNICNIDFWGSRQLLEGLGSCMLTPVQYWELYQEALDTSNSELLESLTSDYFTEPLDRLYYSGTQYEDNPVMVSPGVYSKADVRECIFREARPGWFVPENNINSETAMPIEFSTRKSSDADEWKYWTPSHHTALTEACFALRGYVTSVGKPSFDLGIPIESRQPKQMIRECRKTPLETNIDSDYYQALTRFLSGTVDSKEIRHLNEVWVGRWKLFLNSEDLETCILKEDLIDRLGLENLTCGVPSRELVKLNYSDLYLFLKGLKQELEKYEVQKISFIIGHRNPDTDTVISSIFEAWRNKLMQPYNTFIPIIQSDRLPKEIRELLGSELSSFIIFENDEVYKQAVDWGLCEFIYVDHNYQEDTQKSVSKIIDHHEVSDIAMRQRVPKTLQRSGSTALLIFLKFLGLGYVLDKLLSLLIYGAMLMDTENKAKHKMGHAYDKIAFPKIEARLHHVCGDDLYLKLSRKLFEEREVKQLFYRDYKAFYNYGFAVLKTSYTGILNKLDEIRQLAREVNRQQAFPLTVVKIVLYDNHAQPVKEVMIFEKIEPMPDQLIEDVKKVIILALKTTVINSSYEDHGNILVYYGGNQLSRKVISSAIEKVVHAYDSFVYFKSINKWVARDFLKLQDIKVGDKHYSVTPEGYINYCTYPEAVELLKNSGFSMLSLAEYWAVLDESKQLGDIRFEASLKHNKYIEFLATTNKDFAQIPEGLPALFREGNVDEKGLPLELLTPDHYGESNVWRYWSSPDDDTYVFTRSHIFLLDAPCLDAKMLESESFPNLVIRAVSEKAPVPNLDISSDGQKLIVLGR